MERVFSIFGADLTDYEIEIIIDSGVAREKWEVLTNQIRAYSENHSARSTRARLFRLLKGLGIAAAGAKVLATSWYQNNVRHSDPGAVEFPTKRLRTEKGSVTSKSTTEDTDLKHKPPATAAPALPPSTKPPPKEVEVQPDGTVRHPPVVPKPGIKLEETLEKRHAGTKTTAKMADVEMSGPAEDRNKASEVTQVSRFSNAFEGIPRQYTTILPYEKTLLSQSMGTSAGSLNTMFLLRVNSIYDIFKSTAAWSADPTPVADAADSTTGQVIEEPYWRDHWAQYWEYWTVVECRWKIILCNTTSTGKRSLAMFYGYTGIQQPPLLASGSSGADLTYDTFRRWKGFKKVVVNPNMTAGLNVHSNDDKNVAVVSGVYHPGDGSHEVVEDELAETWVRGDAVPKEQNTICVILTRPPLNDSGTSAITYDIRFEFEYVVQYKDQKVQWHFPTASLTTNFQKQDTTI